MELARLASKQQQAALQGLSGPQSNRGPKIEEKKCYHAIRDGYPQLSQEPLFFQSDPELSQRVIYWVFGLVLGHGHLEKFRARAENTISRSYGHFGGESPCAPKVSLRKCATF